MDKQLGAQAFYGLEAGEQFLETAATRCSDPVGLHARPAAMLAKLAKQFSATVSMRNVSTSGPWANAKSVLSLMTLGVNQDDEIEFKVEGEDEKEALAALLAFMQSELNSGAK